jgi:hypothetical protein
MVGDVVVTNVDVVLVGIDVVVVIVAEANGAVVVGIVVWLENYFKN